MKDAPTDDERRFLEISLRAYRMHNAAPVDPAELPRRSPRKGVGAEILRLYFDGLDDRAIAGQVGASIGSVTATISRARRRHELAGHRRKTKVAGILVNLSDELRGRLLAEASRRNLGVNTFANELLGEALRSRPASAAEQRGKLD